jgi:hypothetical protein
MKTPILISVALLFLCAVSFSNDESMEHRFISEDNSQEGLSSQFSSIGKESVEAKVQFLLDREEITAIIKYYALTMDSRDWKFQGEIFTPEYENYRNGKFSSRSIEDRLAGREKSAEKWAWTQHVASVYSIDIDGDTAFVKSTLHARHWPVDGSKRMQEMLMVGQYRYVLKKTPEGWKISIMRLVSNKKN